GLRAKQVDVPLEGAAVVFEAHQMAVHIAAAFFTAILDVGVGARVGRIGQILAACGLNAAVAVVGQREINLAVGRVDGIPLGAVHFGGTHRVGRQASVDG